MQALIDVQTSAFLAPGAFPPPPDDPALAVVTLTDAEAAKLTQRGVKTVAKDGTVTVFLDPAIVAAEQAAETAAQAASTERTAATTDLRDQYAAAVTRLDAIIANGSTFTAAQVRDGLIDVARIERRLLRVLRAQIGG
jgi:hypothetical protein